MGTKMSLTKNPTKPMTTNPVAVREAIFQNSLASGFVHFFTRRTESLAKSRIGFATTSATSMVEGAARRGPRARASGCVERRERENLCARAFVFIDSREARADARAGRETFVDAGFVRWFGSRVRGVVGARSIDRLID